MNFYIYLVCLFFFFNCSNQTQTSYINLEKAFVDWYFKYNPTKVNIDKYLVSNNFNASYDLDSYNEKYEDINLFKIELSQIDETKLNENQIRRFIKINTILDYLGLSINIQVNENYNILNPLFEIYNGLFAFVKLDESVIDMNDRVENLDKIIESISFQLVQITDNVDCIQKSHSIIFADIYDSFIDLLDDIPISIFSDNQTLDTIDHNILNVKKKLILLKDVVKASQAENCSYSDIRREYLNTFIVNESNESLFNNELKLKILQLKNQIFDLSLSEYIKNNDEPVWVDYDDTLNVINSTILSILHKQIDDDEYLSEIYSANNYIYQDKSLKYIQPKNLVNIEFGSYLLNQNSPIGFSNYGENVSGINIYLNSNFHKFIERNSYSFLNNTTYLHAYIFSNLVLFDKYGLNLNSNELDYIYFEMFLLPASKKFLKNYFLDTASISDTNKLAGKLLLKIESLINAYKLFIMYNSYTEDEIYQLFSTDRIILNHVNIKGIIMELDLNYKNVVKEYFLLNELDPDKKYKLDNYFKKINNVLILNSVKDPLTYN